MHGLIAKVCAFFYLLISAHSGFKKGVRGGVCHNDIFLRENSHEKKIKVDMCIFIFPRDILKLIIPFPVCQETGNGVVLPLPQGK